MSVWRAEGVAAALLVLAGLVPSRTGQVCRYDTSPAIPVDPSKSFAARLPPAHP